MLDAQDGYLRHKSILGRWMLRGLSEDQGCLMLRRAELGKECLRWGVWWRSKTKQNKIPKDLWEARAGEGSKQQPGTLAEEAENFLFISLAR